MTHGPGNSNGHGRDESNAVIDIQQLREKRTQAKKRRAERVFFKNLLSVYSVTDGDNLVPIELLDVSEEGCSFQIPHQGEDRWPRQAEGIPIRLYFSGDTYLEIQVKISNSSPSIDRSVRMVRFGCVVDQSLKSYLAYQQFVRFLKLYAEHSRDVSGSQRGFYSR